MSISRRKPFPDPFAGTGRPTGFVGNAKILEIREIEERAPEIGFAVRQREERPAPPAPAAEPASKSRATITFKEEPAPPVEPGAGASEAKGPSPQPAPEQPVEPFLPNPASRRAATPGSRSSKTNGSTLDAAPAVAHDEPRPEPAPVSLVRTLTGGLELEEAAPAEVPPQTAASPTPATTTGTAGGPMIILRCTNCGQTLRIDDAFAGGVCRCMHCGTIQTVPADAPRVTDGEPSDTTAATDARSLYRREEQHEPSGLDELADVVASSGIGSGLHRRGDKSGRQRSAYRSTRLPSQGEPPRDRGQRKSLAPLLVVLAVILVVGGAGMLAALFLGNDSDTAADGTAPTFAGVPIGNRVVYLLDTGNATQPVYRQLVDATVASARSLGNNGQFQVILWPRDGGDPQLLPVGSLVHANSGNIEELREDFAEATTGGMTDVEPALEAALRQNPDTIILATGKAWQLTSDFSQQVLETVGDRDVTIHTFALGTESDGLGAPLQSIAAATGGQFRTANAVTLTAAATEPDRS